MKANGVAVGGSVFDLCLGRAKRHARFVECGFISYYNASTPTKYDNLAKIVTMSIHVQGFIILDHHDRFPEARRQLGSWVQEGKLKSCETIIKGGLEAAEAALIDLFNGVNRGKLLVEVKNPEEPPAIL